MNTTILVEFTNKSIDEKLASDVIYGWLVDNCSNPVIKLEELEGVISFGVSKIDAVEIKICNIPEWITKHANISFLNGVKK